MTNLTQITVNTGLNRPQDVARIVQRQGMKQTLEGVMNYILSDYLRWDEFDKSSRVAKYVQDGVMELMPIADKQNYSFKYVNCHPHNPQEGLSRSEEHTSELQSRENLVCRLLLEKKKKHKK